MRPAEYRPDIDGLRAIAVLAVFVFHLNRRWLPGGFFGVDIFFVISGYLITSIVRRDCEEGRFRFGRFYQRRIARLLPAFVAVGLATLVGAALVYSPQDLASTGATLSAAAASVANLKFLLQGNYFVLSPDSQPFLHCWSLSVEEQFYLLFPAAFLVLYRRPRALIGLCVLSFVCYMALGRVRPEWAFYLLPARGNCWWEAFVGHALACPGERGSPPQFSSRFRSSADNMPSCRWLEPPISFCPGRISCLPSPWFSSDECRIRSIFGIGRYSHSSIINSAGSLRSSGWRSR
jgi:peptidoglycan/LPS O-acetylase OafA/YrhL